MQVSKRMLIQKEWAGGRGVDGGSLMKGDRPPTARSALECGGPPPLCHLVRSSPKPRRSADFTDCAETQKIKPQMSPMSADGKRWLRGARSLLSTSSERPDFGTTNRTKVTKTNRVGRRCVGAVVPSVGGGSDPAFPDGRRIANPF